MKQDFFHLLSPAEFTALLTGFAPTAPEEADLDHLHGRTLAADIAAPEDLPAADRSCMDGYAVRAADTFGAGDTNPGYLDLAGSAAIDSVPDAPLRPGSCLEVTTGGTLPPGADAVVMVEHTADLGAGTIEVRKSLAPGDNVMLRGEDGTRGDMLLPAGIRLRAQEIGLLAAFGVGRALVHSRPRAGIVSTGDELVPVSAAPRPGRIRDVNSHALACLAAEAGAEARTYGIVPDRREDLTAALARAAAECDLVLVSGGSSVGVRDLTVEVLDGLGAEILAHGVAISPGKPTILARLDNKPVLGLPGQITSAQVVMLVFGQPLLRHLSGFARAFDPALRPSRRALLARNLASKPGREDYVRVALEERAGDLPLAHPRTGKSGLIRTMVEAHGLVTVSARREGLAAGTEVNVWLI
ncbi:MAG: gephyrin-like molybdotransferase Glp [Thermodesulfobacteriota bacterium]